MFSVSDQRGLVVIYVLYLTLKISFYTDGSEETYRNTEKEQFFHNDYFQLLHDASGNFVDLTTQMPTHLIDPYPRCDSLGKPYTKQVVMETR